MNRAASPQTTTTPPPNNRAGLGRIVGLFGVRGELKLAPSRVGDDALDAGFVVLAQLSDGSERELTLRSIRPHKSLTVVTFAEIDSATAAEALVNATLWADRDAIELAEDEYLDDDLVGCRVVDARDGDLGSVRAVHHYPAQDVLELERGALVPLVGAFVRGVDITAKRIDVELPPGLIDDALSERS